MYRKRVCASISPPVSAAHCPSLSLRPDLGYILFITAHSNNCIGLTGLVSVIDADWYSIFGVVDFNFVISGQELMAFEILKFERRAVENFYMAAKHSLIPAL